MAFIPVLINLYEYYLELKIRSIDKSLNTIESEEKKKQLKFICVFRLLDW
jgi:hypothetical protein